ncbi:MAG: hypothetical protein ACLQPH_00510 [Acidimicrobiales bacterium]
MEERTGPDEAAVTAEHDEAAHHAGADRPPTAVEEEAAERHTAETDPDRRREMARPKRR